MWLNLMAREGFSPELCISSDQFKNNHLYILISFLPLSRIYIILYMHYTPVDTFNMIGLTLVFFRSKISQFKCDCDSKTASQEGSTETYQDSGTKGDQ